MANSVSWPKTKLGSVIIDMQSGFAQRPDTSNANIPQLRTNNVSPQGTIDLSDLLSVFVDQNDLEKYRVMKGDVIFNNTNSVEWVGKTAYFDVEGDYVLSNHMTRLRVNQEFLDARFLALYLHYLWGIGQLRHLAKQWVGQAAIDQATLSSLQIPLPPLPEQRRIVAILREADDIRKLRKQANEKTQGIVQALFYDMFGDPATNTKGWQQERLDNLAQFITSGPRNWATYYSSQGARFIRVQNLTNHQLNLNNLVFVTPPDNMDAKRAKIEKGDILFSITGVVGLVAVAPDDIEDAYISQHVALIRPKPEMEPLFISAFLAHEAGGQVQIRSQQYGQTKPGFGLNEIRSLNILMPPLSLQRQFAECLGGINDLKVVQGTNSLSLSSLYQSLLSQAFTGELTATWRKAHSVELAQAALERDILLGNVLPKTVVHEIESASPAQLEVLITDDRSTLLKTLSPLQRALYTLMQKRKDTYFAATRLHSDLQTCIDEHNQYHSEQDTERLYEDFADLNCSLDTLRRELHALATMGLAREAALPIEDEDQPGTIRYITVYRILLDDDDCQQEDLATINPEVAREVLV
jgi:type I restriction enzyme, S subunit